MDFLKKTFQDFREELVKNIRSYLVALLLSGGYLALNLLKDRHGNARTLYSLRHTYATVQIIAGIDYHKLAKNMGTSIVILERHYSHLTPTLAAKELA